MVQRLVHVFFVRVRPNVMLRFLRPSHFVYAILAVACAASIYPAGRMAGEWVVTPFGTPRFWLLGGLIAVRLALVASAVGLWWRMRWGNHLAVLASAGTLILMLPPVFAQGLSARALLGIGGAAMMIWYLRSTLDECRPGWLPPPDEENSAEPFSIVALLPGSPDLSIDDLAAAVESAWGVRPVISDDDEPPAEAESEPGDAGGQGAPMLLGSAPLFPLFSPDHGFFLIHVHDNPYVEDPEQAARAGGLGLDLAESLRRHQSWIAVDIMGVEDDPSDEECRAAYRQIARLLAELLPDDALLLYLPREERMYRVVPRTRDLLRSDDPVAALLDESPAPVIAIPPDDPELLAAVAEARARWPEFVAAFEARGPADKFGVKAPLGAGDDVEHIWLSVDAIEGDRIYGRLENHPYLGSAHRLGDRVHAEIERISDWIVVQTPPAGGETVPVGGFSIALMTRRMQQNPEGRKTP